MGVIGAIISAVLKALLGFFQEGRENDKVRQQTERLAREAERARVELEKAKEGLDVSKNREKIDETVRNLDSVAVLERLRTSVRTNSSA